MRRSYSCVSRHRRAGAERRGLPVAGQGEVAYVGAGVVDVAAGVTGVVWVVAVVDPAGCAAGVAGFVSSVFIDIRVESKRAVTT